MPRSPHLFLVLPILFILASPLSIHAETKVLTAEATYTMGDGETPSFAEAMALQKAKQMALEQAGTYVESYTKVQNYQLTADEIQTIAGGVLQVEILEKKRELIGDGLRHYVKIKATVTTDKMEELVRRIKGKNVAEEYKKLQEDYARLAKEIEGWKQLAAKTPTGPEREATLEQIREREKAFANIQKSEASFYQRLVSGEELFSKALDQLSTKQSERTIVDSLFQLILEQGFAIEIGELNIRATLSNPNEAEILIPVTLRPDIAIQGAIEETARLLGGKIKMPLIKSRTYQAVEVQISKDIETSAYFEQRMKSLSLSVDLEGESKSIRKCHFSYAIGMPATIMYGPSISLTVTTNVPLVQADRIKAVRGSLSEATPAHRNDYLGGRSKDICKSSSPFFR